MSLTRDNWLNGDEDPEPQEETLEEFVVRAKAEIDAFAANWLEQQTTPNADHWPMSMTPGEWDEQFRADLGA